METVTKRMSSMGNTRQRLADETGMTCRTIQSIDHREPKPSTQNLNNVGSGYDVGFSDFNNKFKPRPTNSFSPQIPQLCVNF